MTGYLRQVPESWLIRLLNVLNASDTSPSENWVSLSFARIGLVFSIYSKSRERRQAILLQVTAAGSARASREEGMAAAMAWPAARARTRAEIERILVIWTSWV